MKKKLFILALAIMVVMCLFAISVSAEATNITNVANDGIPDWDQKVFLDGKEYALWEMDADGIYHPLIWYNNGSALASVRADNVKDYGADKSIPYVSYGIYSDSSYAEMQSVTIYLPDNTTTFDGKATIVIANFNAVKLRTNRDLNAIKSTTFAGSTALKYIYLPTTINTVAYQSNGVFQNCTSLISVIFAKGASIKTIGNNFVMGCSSIQCISFPSSVKSFAHNSINGSAVRAVYIGDTLESISSDGRWNEGAFYNCTNLYLVQNGFEYYGYEGTLPAKPEVYFFPNTLSSLPEHAFRGCSSMNTTVVFGTNITSWSGHMFTNWTTDSTGDKNVVFLGNMTSFSITENINCSSYIHFYFPNTTDKSVLTYASGKEGTVYYYTELGYAGRARYGSVTWLTIDDLSTTTNSYFSKVKTTPHIANPKTSTVIEATCYSNRSELTKCFCNTIINDGEIAGTMLDTHNYVDDFDCTTCNYCENYGEGKCDKFLAADATEHIEAHDVIYANGFTSAGVHNTYCSNATCKALDKVENLGAMFTHEGYSYKSRTYGGIDTKFRINTDAMKLYEQYEGVLHFGIVIANANHFANVDAFIEDGKLTSTNADGKKTGIIVEMTSREYEYFNCYIDGFKLDDPDHIALGLIIAGYVYGEDESDITYIQKDYKTDSDDATLETPYVAMVTKDKMLKVVNIMAVKDFKPLKESQQ